MSEATANIDRAVAAMVGHLVCAGGAGVPFTALMQTAVDNGADDGSPPTWAVTWPNKATILLAADLPRPACDAWTAMVERHRDDMRVDETSPLVFACDGAPLLTLPLVKSIREYKTERWLPVLVRWIGAPPSAGAP